MDSGLEAGVTVVVTRTVRPGAVKDAEEWFMAVAAVAGRYPGHQGITIFRPRPGGRDYTFVFRFDNEDNLSAWEKSVERDHWVKRAEAFTERVTIHKHTGLETWFAAPGAPIAVPPRWKMVIVSWSVAFPIIQILSMTIGVWLADLPRIVVGAVVGLGMSLLMTYAAMPLVTKLLRAWLYPPPPP